MRSPAKSDTLRSTDSASGGETLEERSSKEVGFYYGLPVPCQGDIPTHCHTQSRDHLEIHFCLLIGVKF